MILQLFLAMIVSMPPGATRLLQQADTVVSVPARDGVDLVMAVSAGLVGLAFLGVCLTLVVALVQARKLTRSLGETRRRISADPGMEHLRNTARHVEEITATVRTEAERMSDSVGRLSDRLKQASERMEERIEEFNALMEVIQAEAEDVFVDTASTARGVRKGVGRLTEPRGRRSVEPDEER